MFLQISQVLREDLFSHDRLLTLEMETKHFDDFRGEMIINSRQCDQDNGIMLLFIWYIGMFYMKYVEVYIYIYGGKCFH